MNIVTVDFDMDKWRTCDQGIIQPYTHRLLAEALDFPLHRLLFRGGFGRTEDYERLLEEGTDKEVIFAAPIRFVAKEPWVRGSDPLFWALRGHGHGYENGWNPVSAIVAYDEELMYAPPGSTQVEFAGNPLDSLVGIVELEFDRGEPR